ncbi:hypothetical protein KUTeg_002604 [Tegillarca granosa]|uniref:Macro domain-containing protein n=1 Tax=Tegillarca granosa TaxID=220873 RepID=A0ABQ9FW49_TEGGR|nr:hypothetical protein KUTeg_002604 [Tegillarca granosa]
MSQLGYGYTRSEVVTLSSDYAVDLGLRDDGKDLTMKWFYNFIRRWPEIHIRKPSSLSELHAKSTSPECINNYFTELDKILTKYDLKDKPHLIYNVDEKGINTGGTKPPNIVTSKEKVAQVVTSERSQTITVLGCGNAAGANIPPFLVFPEKRMLPELLTGATPGCDGTVSETGYSNSDIFNSYIKNHFLKYVQGRDPSQTILLLYDGHRSHISLSLIQWARKNNIILFVLPPHTSHLLQPMDVGCFGPFEAIYQQSAHKFMRQNIGRSITRYDVCALACKVYNHALCPENIRSAFRKSGIYPLSADVVDSSCTMPSLVYKGQVEIERDNQENNDNSKEKSEQKVTDGASKETGYLLDKTTEFFNKRGGELQKKARRSISSIIGGKAITEQDTFEKVKEYTETSKNKSKNQQTEKLDDSQQPGTSGININNSVELDENDEEILEEEKCCICKKFEPEALKNKPYIQLRTLSNEVDIIVNSTARNLNLTKGAVSNSVLQTGGPSLQMECSTNYPNGIQFGEVAVTNGGNLQCSKVLHGSIPSWDVDGAALGVLRTFMDNCLTLVNQYGCSSVAFPALGTGNLNFPKDVVAKEMFQCVIDFSSNQPNSSVTEVKFVLYDKDIQTVQAFEAEANRRIVMKKAMKVEV